MGPEISLLCPLVPILSHMNAVHILPFSHLIYLRFFLTFFHLRPDLQTCPLLFRFFIQTCSLLFRFFIQTSVWISHTSHTCYMPQPLPASSFHHLVKTTYYLHHYAIQFSQASCHFPSFGYKYSPQHTSQTPSDWKLQQSTEINCKRLH